MSMLVTLDAMKTYLGIPLIDTSDDDFLTQQITVISDSIEGYCGRVFTETSYVQTYYTDEFNENTVSILLYHYPVTTLTQVYNVTDSVAVDSDDYRLHYPTAKLKNLNSTFNVAYNTFSVTYDAGYAVIPSTIQQVVFSLVEERYNKYKNGISLNFGSDVQRIAIPGAISVDFDYTLQANERKTSYGMFLGNYVNVLDTYRSERVLIGSIGVNYVQ